MSGQGSPRVTAIGGGHGLSRTLAALCHLGLEPTAVVSMADDGGSSGRLRRDYGVPPPGDLRRALSTLVRDPVSRHLLEHRFRAGDLAGHALGNLLLLAAADIHGGDLAGGVEVLSGLLGTRGRVVPAGLDPVSLDAELADGEVLHGQELITRTPGVRRVRLDPADARATPAAVRAVVEADAVVIGPGSLFTSLVPPLLLAELADGLTTTDATTILVANIREQPGESSGMDLRAHLDALFAHLPAGLDLDVLVANSSRPERVEDQVAPWLVPVTSHPRVRRVLVRPVADARGGHDVMALAGVLAELAGVVAPAAPTAPLAPTDPGRPRGA